MIYEGRTHRPLSRRHFAHRMARHFGVALLLVAGSLVIGMAGYMGFEHLAWRDAFLNSAMLIGGMGPVDAPKSDAGKLFAGLYAIYCGLVVIITASVIFAPVLHRMMHKFHWKDDEK